MDDPKEARERKAKQLIDELAEKGYPAKIWAPLPQHKTSGHTHIVALCTFEDLLNIGGVKRPKYMNVQGRMKLVTRDISEEKMNELAESIRRTRGWFYVDEPGGPLWKGGKKK